MENEIDYRELFNRFAEPGDEFGEKWIETFVENIIEEGEVVGSHSWNSDNPGAGVGMILIYRFRGLFFTSNDFGINGPYEGFSEAAEAVNLLTVTETTERLWVDYKVTSNSGTCNDGQNESINNLIN
jgi:hypothetical protein